MSDVMNNRGKMLAARAFAPGDIRCVEVPVPVPGPGEMLVSTESASICGSDLHMALLGWAISKWPAPAGHPGHEAAGIVVESLSPRFKPGDRVLTAPHIWNSLCFAEYQAIDEAHVSPLPSNMPFDHATMAQQLGTVIYAAKRLTHVEGAVCAVVGQGSAGLFWNYVLKRQGAASVIEVEPLAHRRSVGMLYGADLAVDPASDQVLETVMDSTGGQGADIVVEAVGKADTLSSAFDLVRDEGQVVLFGLPETDAEVPFRYGSFFRKRATAFTVFGSQDEPGQSSYMTALEWIARGEIDPAPILTHTLPIEQVGRAFAMADARENGVVKVSLSF